MSLVGTLAKVALGVAAAKGIGHVIGRMGQTAPMNVPGSQPGQVDPLSSFSVARAKRAGGLAVSSNSSPRVPVLAVLALDQAQQRRRQPVVSTP